MVLTMSLVASSTNWETCPALSVPLNYRTSAPSAIYSEPPSFALVPNNNRALAFTFKSYEGYPSPGGSALNSVRGTNRANAFVTNLRLMPVSIKWRMSSSTTHQDASQKEGPYIHKGSIDPVWRRSAQTSSHTSERICATAK